MNFNLINTRTTIGGWSVELFTFPKENDYSVIYDARGRIIPTKGITTFQLSRCLAKLNKQKYG